MRTINREKAMNLYKSETYINDLDRTLRAVVNLQEIQGK